MKRALIFGTFASAALLLSACNGSEQADAPKASAEPAVTITQAVAYIQSNNDEGAGGKVTFTHTDKGTEVKADINGLSAGKHGFHIHQYGNCSASDYTSAGGHYNPHGADHSGPEADKRHVGDMGNLEVGEDGTATLEYVDPVIKLNGPAGIAGRAVVIHAGEDDLSSQPSGAAGPRVGCGVIGVVLDK